MPAIDQTFDQNINNNNINDNNGNESTIVSILHFNDCYNVEPRSEEPSGGASRLVTAFKLLRDSDTMVLFSGDIIAPSISLVFNPIINSTD